MTVTCKYCGETNPEGTIVCPWCGRRDQEVAEAVQKAAEATKRKARQQREAAEKERRRKARQENGLGAKILDFMDRQRFLEVYSSLIREQQHVGPKGIVIIVLTVLAIALPFATLLLIFAT